MSGQPAGRSETSLPCRGEEPGFGCQPRVRWPNENYKHPGGGCVLPCKPPSALVSNPKAAQSRSGEGPEQAQTSP